MNTDKRYRGEAATKRSAPVPGRRNTRSLVVLTLFQRFGNAWHFCGRGRPHSGEFAQLCEPRPWAGRDAFHRVRDLSGL